MITRRDFARNAAFGVAASTMSGSELLNSVLPSRQSPGALKKAVLISMLPKQMSYADRFKLAVDVGFEGIEAQTITDPKEADQIKEASMQAKIPI
nr:hypothetical protein [Acidobacteriota bacterium]